MSSPRLDARIVILGGGLTGLSAAWHLRNEDCLLLEKNSRLGGLARTDVFDGFHFDFGSHIWFTKDERADLFIADLPGLALRRHTRSAWVHIYDRLVPAPFQANLFGLPLDVVSECLLGYVAALRSRDTDSYRTFADWLLGSFGEGIFRHFMHPYNSKVWTVPPEELATDWQGSRVDVPEPSELIDGAIGLRTNSLGSNAVFRYPEEGGIESIALGMAKGCPRSICDAEVVRIDPVARSLSLSDGTRVNYELLISTIPIPILIRAMTEVSADVRDAATSLRSTQLLLVNIALSKRPDTGYHWMYFAEPKYPFFRVSFLHNYADSICPEGAGAVQAECAFPATARVDSELIAEVVQTQLAECGYIERSDVVSVHTRLEKPAYVLCDRNRSASLPRLQPYLDGLGIHCCGRFGAWDYINMDGCIVAGQNAAGWVRSRT